MRAKPFVEVVVKKEYFRIKKENKGLKTENKV